MALTAELLRELDLPQFEDAVTARRYLEDQTWPDAIVCAHCGGVDTSTRLGGAAGDRGLIACNACRGSFTITVKTVFHRTRVPLHRWLQATAAIEKAPCGLEELADALDVSYKTAWRIRGIIRPDLAKYGRLTSGGRRTTLCYPFMPETKRQLPEHELLRLINEAVPRTIPEDRRADICQEMAIAVLIGDVDVADLSKAWMPLFRKVYKQHPTVWAPLSLDAPIPGTDDLLLIDTISNEDSIWNRI